jgi:hypothetical protein
MASDQPESAGVIPLLLVEAQGQARILANAPEIGSTYVQRGDAVRQ